MVTNVISQFARELPAQTHSRFFKNFILIRKCGNFISIYKMNRTLHGRLGIEILSCCTESIPHECAFISSIYVYMYVCMYICS